MVGSDGPDRLEDDAAHVAARSSHLVARLNLRGSVDGHDSGPVPRGGGRGRRVLAGPHRPGHRNRVRTPRVALSDDGTVATGVWGPRPGVGQVQASVASNGTWGTTTTLENAADPFPDTAVSANGSVAAVTWNRHDGTVGSAWWSDGTWQPAATLAAGGQAKVGMGDEPSTAVAVWRATAGGVQAAGVAAAPSPPTAVHATAGDGAASITWAAPAADGGRPVDSYHVAASPGGASCESATPACTVSGLTNGTTYSFTATATNAAGTSAQSATSNGVTPMASADARRDTNPYTVHEPLADNHHHHRLEANGPYPAQQGCCSNDDHPWPGPLGDRAAQARQVDDSSYGDRKSAVRGCAETAPGSGTVSARGARYGQRNTGQDRSATGSTHQVGRALNRTSTVESGVSAGAATRHNGLP